jgi:hypothetical protein
MNPFQPHQYFPRDSKQVYGHRFQVEPPAASVRRVIYGALIILAIIVAVML